MKKMLLMSVILALSACTDVSGASKALKDQGLDPTDVGGYAWFGCSDKDVFKTKFTAENIKGRVVKGQVCSGWLKGATIRFN